MTSSILTTLQILESRWRERLGRSEWVEGEMDESVAE